MKDIERIFIELTKCAIHQGDLKDGFFFKQNEKLGAFSLEETLETEADLQMERRLGQTPKPSAVNCADSLGKQSDEADRKTEETQESKQREDWKKLFELSMKNKMGAIVYDAAAKAPSLPKAMKTEWDHLRFQIFVRQRGHEHVLFNLLDEIEAGGIPYALFKGCVLADLYPNPAYRVSADTDILIDQADRQTVGQMIQKRGYVIQEHESNGHVDCYKNEKTGHTIELHTSVFEDYEGERIDAYKEANIDGAEHRIWMDINGRQICTLGLNEHLLYQIYHMIKHFTLEGANVRFFTDIALYINKYEKDLSKDIFWKWMDKLQYTKFCENFFQICIDYFGMNPGFMVGHSAKASREALEAMIVDFIYQGDEQALRDSKWQLTATMRPYLVGERTSVSKSKAGRRISYLFPKPSELNENYTYAKKCVLLLPVAWVHRVIRKLIWQSQGHEDEYSASQKLDLVESKLGLLGSVGLLEEG